MDFQGKAVLVNLEEDNISRAYFRIQPLMTQDGAVPPEEKAAFPDDGFLRIVPDKNEQHTFKERMRSLAGLCLMDLRFLPSDANKIRTNKNYSPTRGESNQFIVYSDAVRALPDDLLYQVVAESEVARASTPFVYIRNGANIQGPFRREDQKAAGDIGRLPPDSGEIHAVTLTSGQELLFYWPRQEAPVQANALPPAAQEAAAPQPAVTPPAAPKEQEAAPAPLPNAFEQIQEMNAPLSENANRLNAPSAPAPEYIPDQPGKPLAGTRLYQPSQRPTAARRAHNPLMETVEQQRYAARYEAPGAVLPQSAQLRDVQNPVDAFKRALQGLWQSQEAQGQAVSVLLAQPGMRALLAKALAAENNDLTLAAMHSQLQELEAERLMTLMQLDDAKKNLSEARQEALGKTTREEQKQLDFLRQEQQKAQAALDALSAALPPLEEKRQAAAETIAAAALEEGRQVLAPAPGQGARKEELIQRVEQCLKAAGFLCESGDAQALLTAYALSKGHMALRSATEADAKTAAAAFAHALGAALGENVGLAVSLLPGGSAPALIVDEYCGLDDAGGAMILTCGEMEDYPACYRRFPCASVAIAPALDAFPGALPPCAPVRQDGIAAALLGETPLNAETREAVNALRRAIAAAGKPLPLITVERLCRFIAATQNDLKGGVAEALDRGASIFVAPHLSVYDLPADGIRPLLAAMPRALKALNT